MAKSGEKWRKQWLKVAKSGAGVVASKWRKVAYAAVGKWRKVAHAVVECSENWRGQWLKKEA